MTAAPGASPCRLDVASVGYASVSGYANPRIGLCVPHQPNCKV